jgi:hypothetical protein
MPARDPVFTTVGLVCAVNRGVGQRGAGFVKSALDSEARPAKARDSLGASRDAAQLF